MWASIAAKNKEQHKDQNKEQKSNNSSPKYKENNWTDINTLITFLSKQVIVTIAESYLITHMADIVGDYAVFSLDLTWCDLDMCKRLNFIKKNKTDKEFVQDLSKKFDVICGDNPFINDPLMWCEIEMRNVIELSISESIPIYYNEVTFYKERNNSMWCYKVSLDFLRNQIRSLVKINNYEEFVLWIEQIYKENPRLNRLVMEHRNKTRKLKEIFEIWTKIFRPRLVYDNLKNLTIF
jgi:hypothetical protein